MRIKKTKQNKNIERYKADNINYIPTKVGKKGGIVKSYN